MKTAVIYARYSSERQTKQSIEGQLRVCKEYAERNDILVADTYIDRATTGTNDNRRDFQRMLKDCSKRAWDIVLVYKIDRFSRNKYEMAMHKRTLKDNGIKLVSAMENIPDTPEGIILESLLEGMAEYYSAELSQKVRRGMNESRQKGLYTGGSILYGYRVENKKILVHNEEAEIVRQIFFQYNTGIIVKDIINALHAQGLSNRGKPFMKNTIYRMLVNEKYIGIYRHKGEVFTNIYPPIVSKELFQVIQQKVESNKYGKHVPVYYLLKNKIYCAYCGQPMTSESGTTKTGNIKRYYKCFGRKNGSNCTKSILRKEEIENLVLNTTLKIFGDKNSLDYFAEKVLEAHNKRIHEQSALKLLLSEKKNVDKSIENILSAIEKGVVTNSTTRRLEELETRLSDLTDQIAIEQAKLSVSLSKEEIEEFIITALKKEPRPLINTLIEKIILYDDKVQIYYHYTNRKRPDDERQGVLFYSNIGTIHAKELLTGEPYSYDLAIEAFI